MELNKITLDYLDDCTMLIGWHILNIFYYKDLTALGNFILLAFHFMLMPLRKTWILFSLQQWVYSRADLALYLWYGNQSRRRKTKFKTLGHEVPIPVYYPKTAKGLKRIQKAKCVEWHAHLIDPRTFQHPHICTSVSLLFVSLILIGWCITMLCSLSIGNT